MATAHPGSSCSTSTTGQSMVPGRRPRVPSSQRRASRPSSAVARMTQSHAAEMRFTTNRRPSRITAHSSDAPDTPLCRSGPRSTASRRRAGVRRAGSKRSPCGRAEKTMCRVTRSSPWSQCIAPSLHHSNSAVWGPKVPSRQSTISPPGGYRWAMAPTARESDTPSGRRASRRAPGA